MDMEGTLPLILEVLDDIDHFKHRSSCPQPEIAQSASDEFCTFHNMQTRISCSGRGSELALPVLAALSFAQTEPTSSFLSLSSFLGDSLVEERRKSSRSQAA